MPTASTTPDNRAELVLQQLEQLPTLPAVAVRVLEMTGDGRTNAKDLVRLIESDPSLTARLLRIVHRADGGLRGDLNSIERAVVFLGFEAVRNAVLAVGVFETFGPAASHDKGQQGRRFDREAFWKHCVAVACMAELLAEAGGKALAPTTASDAFVAGLLHDIGKVAIDAALPKSFARVVDAVEVLRGDIADVERTVIGLDHHTVGKRLSERWMLPQMFRDAIWLHGQRPAALPEACRNPVLVNLVTLADIAVRQQHLGYSGNYAFNVPVPQLLEAIGLSQSQLDDAASKLVSRVEPRCKVLGLGEATSEDLYRQAITQANRELGRMTDQLAMKNRKLAVRAKFFEALSHFHDDLRPDSPPATVLFAIAQTAGQVLEAWPVAAFSMSARGDAAEVMIVNAAGEVAGRRHIAATRHEPHAAGRPERPVLRAGESLEWLTSEFAPVLGGADLYWIALESDGAIIGGIVWGASADETTRLAQQSGELSALAGGWSLALRTCQVREESRTLHEQLADANRQLSSAQDEMARTRMLATVGEMAAGAAHEMNNPLAVISGRSQLLAAQLSDAEGDSKLAKHASLIAEQAQRLSDMISELMEFAKPAPSRPESCELTEVIRDALSQANSLIELADRRIGVTLNDDVPAVKVDASQLARALAEILANAAQVTDAEIGRIDVSAAFDRYGGKVVLSVADDGCGMDEHVLSRAFDPFYSALPAGRRRGMGLAKAVRWIEASGGSVRLESTPGQGTRVVIVLEAADAAGATATREIA
jgi:putative nucleotidyltransferase with HDIG domain